MTTKLNTTEARALVERLTGYTEGPWRAARNSAFWEINPTISVGKGNPHTIGDVCSSFPFNPDGGLQEANARLIAAAPDLHRHLTAALAENERLREGPTVKEAARVLIPVFEKRHEDWARSKGRNPKDYVSHHTTTLDALRALAGETDQ